MTIIFLVTRSRVMKERIREVLDSIKFKSSLANPYLVELEPGVFDCEVTDNELVVPPFVTIVGAGIHATTVTATMTRQFGTFVLDEGAELRFLTVRNEGSPTQSSVVGISLLQGVGRLTHVRAFAGNGVDFSIGVLAANANTKLDIEDSIIEGAKDAVSPELTANI